MNEAAAVIEPISADWEAEIRLLERGDRLNPPPRDAALFIGSSSLALWNDMASDLVVPVINRGFGGSQLRDSTYFAPRLVWPHQPRMVLLYAGDNDLASGRTPAQVLHDWQAFVQRVREKQASVPIAFISIKPSPSRVELMPLAWKANVAIRYWIEEHNQPEAPLIYIDVWSAMLDGTGQPRAELFIEDDLHLNRQGYALWTQIIRPYLD
jgi:lysophospholipase L1-like esterase